jgi:hypothetical protein
MASLRKKYQSVETPTTHNDAPVASTLVVQAAEPPPAADDKPLEKPAESSSPADEAAKNALKARLQEMERAETLVHQQQPQQGEHRLAAEPPQQQQSPADQLEQAISAMPERVKRWYRAHPEYLVDPEKAAHIQYCHHRAARETGEQFTDPYFERMESLLGFRQQPQPQQRQPQPNGNGHAPAAPARNGAQPVRQQRPGPAVSAPPSRESPSMTTGRATGHRAPLSEVEMEIARNSGLSPEEYMQQKEKMLRLKAQGAVQ